MSRRHKRVFLSYGHRDSLFVRFLANDIRAMCLDLWMDELEILPAIASDATRPERIFKSSVPCTGADGLISHIAPTLVRKGIGEITLLDDDAVEASILNRHQRIGSVGAA